MKQKVGNRHSPNIPFLMIKGFHQSGNVPPTKSRFSGGKVRFQLSIDNRTIAPWAPSCTEEAMCELTCVLHRQNPAIGLELVLPRNSACKRPWHPFVCDLSRITAWRR